MSGPGQISASALQGAALKLEIAITGVTASKYLAGECKGIKRSFEGPLMCYHYLINLAAGLVVLLYDHCLLLEEEVCPTL